MIHDVPLTVSSPTMLNVNSQSRSRKYRVCARRIWMTWRCNETQQQTWQTVKGKTRMCFEPCRCMNKEQLCNTGRVKEVALMALHEWRSAIHECCPPVCPWHSTLTNIEEELMFHLSRLSWYSTSARQSTIPIRYASKTLVVPRVRDNPTVRTVSMCPDTHRTPWVSEVSTNSPVATDKNIYYTFHSPRVRGRPKNCASLEEVERHRDTSRCGQRQTEVNSVSVAEDVHKVDRISHKNVQVHQWGKTPETAYHVGTSAQDPSQRRPCVAAHLRSSDQPKTSSSPLPRARSFLQWCRKR